MLAQTCRCCTLRRTVRKVIGTTGVCDGHFKPLEVKARLCFQSGAAIAIPSGSVCSVRVLTSAMSLCLVSAEVPEMRFWGWPEGSMRELGLLQEVGRGSSSSPRAWSHLRADEGPVPFTAVPF